MYIIVVDARFSEKNAVRKLSFQMVLHYFQSGVFDMRLVRNYEGETYNSKALYSGHTFWSDCFQKKEDQPQRPLSFFTVDWQPIMKEQLLEMLHDPSHYAECVKPFTPSYDFEFRRSPVPYTKKWRGKRYKFLFRSHKGSRFDDSFRSDCSDRSWKKHSRSKRAWGKHKQNGRHIESLRSLNEPFAFNLRSPLDEEAYQGYLNSLIVRKSSDISAYLDTQYPDSDDYLW